MFGIVTTGFLYWLQCIRPTKPTRRLYRLLTYDFLDIYAARLEARRVDYITAADPSSASAMYTSVFNTKYYPYIDFFREVEKICIHKQAKLESWNASGCKGSRPKTPFLKTILKASRWIVLPYSFLCHEVQAQAQARGDYMWFNGACRLITEGRFPELVVKMKLDEWDLDVEFGGTERKRMEELALVKKVEEKWIESLQVGTF